MAYIPKQWKDLPDETTPIQASDLNHIEQGVDDLSTNVDTLNTNVGDLSTLNTTDKSSIVGAINEVYQNNVYSTNEIVIGKWIDGKPIYRKVFSGTFGDVKTHFSQSEIGYETVIKAYGIMNSIWGNWWHFPTYFTESAYYIATYYTTEIITIEHGGNYNDNSQIRFIIEYTKTTD